MLERKGNIAQSGRAARRIGKRHAVKLDRGHVFLLLRIFLRHIETALERQNRRHTLCARRSLRHTENEVRHLDELDEDLRHVVIKRQHLSLRQNALVDLSAAHAQNCDNGKIDHHIRHGVKERRNLADKQLRR